MYIQLEHTQQCDAWKIKVKQCKFKFSNYNENKVIQKTSEYNGSRICGIEEIT
jgi:hypothetical protein